MMLPLPEPPSRWPGALQLEVIAEGVETREHLKLLNDLQCTRIQGYLYSRPLPSHEIEKCLKKEWRFVVE